MIGALEALQADLVLLQPSHARGALAFSLRRRNTYVTVRPAIRRAEREDRWTAVTGKQRGSDVEHPDDELLVRIAQNHGSIEHECACVVSDESRPASGASPRV
jgi:hypothetical protein